VHFPLHSLQGKQRFPFRGEFLVENPDEHNVNFSSRNEIFDRIIKEWGGRRAPATGISRQVAQDCGNRDWVLCRSLDVMNKRCPPAQPQLAEQDSGF
jgi:hypothetical protein